MQVERRGPTPRPRVLVNQQREEPVPEAKPYSIPKQLVMDAYQRVRQNRGAAVAEGQVLGAFEQGLTGHLHKNLHPLSFGSYIPPPPDPPAIPTQDRHPRPLVHTPAADH